MQKTFFFFRRFAVYKLDCCVKTSYPNIKKLRLVFLLFCIFIDTVSSAQIISIAPQANLPIAPATYHELGIPVATDAIMIARASPMQVTISTASALYPELHYNYDNGKIEGTKFINTTAIFGTRHVYLDDVALCYNGASLWAFICCRVENAGNTTDIYVYKANWNGTSFMIGATPLYIDTRTEQKPVDYYDRVSMAYAAAQYAQSGIASTELGMAYNKNGDIIVKNGLINLVNGSITFAAVNNTVTLFKGGSTAYPGSFSNPDIATGHNGHFAVSTLYRDNNDQRILVEVSNHRPNNIMHNWYLSTAYTAACIGKKIRTPRIDEVDKYEYAVCFNELDITNKKSAILLVARGGQVNAGIPAGTPSRPLVVNSELEPLCDSNSNYTGTGFPVVKYLDEHYGRCEVVWQQIACNKGSTGFHRMNAISKRFQLDYNPVATITPENNNGYFYISNDKGENNTVFPCITSLLYGNCLNFYAFGSMDAGATNMEQISYKKSTCNSGSLRPFIAIQQKNSNEIADYLERDKPALFAYPNPGKDVIQLLIHGFNGNTLAYLYNATGALLNTINATDKTGFDIDTQHLAAGNYLIQIIDQKGTAQHKKIVIIK